MQGGDGPAPRVSNVTQTPKNDGPGEADLATALGCYCVDSQEERVTFARWIIRPGQGEGAISCLKIALPLSLPAAESAPCFLSVSPWQG